MKKLLTILCVLCFLGARAQIYTNPNPTMYGIQYQRFKPNLVLHIPHLSDTSSIHTNDTTTQIGEYNGVIYYHLGTGYWTAFGNGSGVLPTLAKLYFDQNYFITGVNPYDPSGNDLTVTINPDSLATVTYVNNFFADTTYIFGNDVQQRTNTPPASPADSTWWLVGNNPTGVWTSFANLVVQRIGTGYAPYDLPVSSIVNVLNPAQQWQRQPNGTWKLKNTFVLAGGNTIRLPVFVGAKDNHGTGFLTHDTVRFYIDSLGRKYFPEYASDTSTQYTITPVIIN